MVRTKRDCFRKDSDYYEVCVPPNSDYQTVCTASAEVIGIESSGKDEKEEFRLFRCDGTMIANRDLLGEHEKWTMERYLKVLNRSSSQVKFGIGLVELV